MDSITQIALGATIGGLIGHRQYGRKSVLIGAICGTIPDLDVVAFVNSDPITSMTAHRGFSHSILFALLTTPVFAYLFSRLKWFKVGFKDRAIWLIVFLGLLTHMILDALTIYGTQLLWPLNSPPIGTGSIFIIDPLYTLPMLFALGVYLTNQSLRFMKYTLIVSCCYLMWGLGVQSYVMKQAQNSLPPSASSNILVQTTPFNILLWRVIALEGGTYKVGYLSLFDKNKTIQFMPYSRASDGLIEDVRDLPKFQRMAWFTKDFYKLEAIDNKIIISDLRMGLEPDNYIFAFQIATQEDGSISVITPVRHTSQKGINRLSNVWKRIWDENHSL